MIHNKNQLPDIQKKAGKALGAFLVVMALLTVLLSIIFLPPFRSWVIKYFAALRP